MDEKIVAGTRRIDQTGAPGTGAIVHAGGGDRGREDVVFAEGAFRSRIFAVEGARAVAGEAAIEGGAFADDEVVRALDRYRIITESEGTNDALTVLGLSRGDVCHRNAAATIRCATEIECDLRIQIARHRHGQIRGGLIRRRNHRRDVADQVERRRSTDVGRLIDGCQVPGIELHEAVSVFILEEWCIANPLQTMQTPNFRVRGRRQHHTSHTESLDHRHHRGCHRHL